MNIYQILLRKEYGYGKNMDEMVKCINNNIVYFVKLNLNLEDKKIKFVEKLKQIQIMCNFISNFNDEILKIVERLDVYKEILLVEQIWVMFNFIKL